MSGQTISRHFSCFFMSDAVRAPDWRAALIAAPHGCGLILRDYDAPDRSDCASDMAAFCRRQNRHFIIAGDRRLARHLRVSFHCPSHLLPRPLYGRTLTRHDTAAVHNEKQLLLAARAGFHGVFISPVFATNTHPGARPLGPLRARHLALLAKKHGMKAFALGGLNAQQWRRLTGLQQITGPFAGFAAIDAFARHERPRPNP